MTRLYREVIGWFEANMPVAETELHYDSPFHLVVAVILSAQCTDKRVNLVTPALFERFPGPREMADATVEEIYGYISSVSYPNNKARHLQGMASTLLEEFGGIVPDDVEQLQKLPGVGRKTANVVASVIYDKPVIAVDTHVFRVARRIGLSRGRTVLKVEEDLTRGFPAELRPKAHHWLILHGRYVCTAIKPKCEACGLAPWCKHFRKLSSSAAESAAGEPASSAE